MPGVVAVKDAPGFIWDRGCISSLKLSVATLAGFYKAPSAISMMIFSRSKLKLVV